MTGPPTVKELGLQDANIIQYVYTESQQESGLIERTLELTTAGQDPPINIVTPSHDLYVVASVEIDGGRCHTTLYLKPPRDLT